ncbi:carbohydrate ABC transporter permease [Evansella sp. AB-rgal1]|uniref:carbohydrate ABC transporter permease n=1 Tax=Evansella sp. AB-rgal1 TaxID=3242696 RepID=UPI00359ED9DC
MTNNEPNIQVKPPSSPSSKKKSYFQRNKDFWGSTQRRKRALAGYTFIAPAYLLFVIFLFIPVIWAFYLSFTSYTIFTPGEFVGIGNYSRLVNDNSFRTALWNTTYYALMVIPLNISISLCLALLVNRKMKGMNFFRAAYYVPVVTSIIAASMIWMWLYDSNNGLINYVLIQLGFNPQSWLNDPNLALPALAFMRVWKGVGWNMVIFLAGLQSIPKTLYEAASIEGAGGWKSFWKITWPLLAPTTFFVFVMATISTFQTFGEIYAMTSGGPVGSTTTLVYLIFVYGFERYEMGYAAAIAFVLFFIIFVLTLINMFITQKKVNYDL